MTKIKYFYLEESKLNKKLMILIAVDDNNEKWVCSGDHWHPTYLKKYNESADTK